MMLNTQAMLACSGAATIAKTGSATGQATGTTLSFAHTTDGSNRLLAVSVIRLSATDNVTSITYGGVAMTRIGTAMPGNSNVHGRRSYLYRLLNPPLGTNQVVITGTGSFYTQAHSVSFKNAAQSGQPTASGAQTSTTGGALVIPNTLAVANKRSAHVAAWDWTIGGTLSFGAGTTSADESPNTPLMLSDPLARDTGSSTIAVNTTVSTHWCSIGAVFKSA